MDKRLCFYSLVECDGCGTKQACRSIVYLMSAIDGRHRQASVNLCPSCREAVVVDKEMELKLEDSNG